MKTIFDKSTRDELIRRISLLNEESQAQWGKMTVYQMLKHCTMWEEMITGKQKYKRVFIGRLFGKVALKGLMKDDRPLTRNSPSIAELIITGDGNIEEEKAKWISQIEAYPQFNNTGFVHPFFGKMETAHIGYLAYKHADHHLRQFNC